MATILNTKFLIESRNIVHKLRTDKINKKSQTPKQGNPTFCNLYNIVQIYNF